MFLSPRSNVDELWTFMRIIQLTIDECIIIYAVQTVLKYGVRGKM